MYRGTNKYFMISLSVHLAVVLVLVIVPSIIEWIRRSKPHEIVTYVHMAPVPPEVPDVVPVETPPPPPPPPPVVPEKKKIERSKKRVRRPSPDPPRPEPLSEDKIREQLAREIPRDQAPSRVVDDLPAWYYDQVRRKMYEAWDQPSELGAGNGIVATVEIRVQQDGSIVRRKLIRPSGHSLMDQSVMQAVESVPRLKALPSRAGKNYKDITIDFELTM